MRVVKSGGARVVGWLKVRGFGGAFGGFRLRWGPRSGGCLNRGGGKKRGFWKGFLKGFYQTFPQN